MVLRDLVDYVHPNLDPDGYVSSDDSDVELQKLYEADLLKPGLHELVDSKRLPKNYVNNIKALREKLQEFKRDDLAWIERLDFQNDLAPMAPEMALQLQEQQQRASLSNARLGAQASVDEFKRESLFYRQAQTACVEGFNRLKSLGIPTKRPDDYFAEMAKTDDHMQKVRRHLVKRKAVEDQIQKAKKLREQRKYNKQLQVEAKLKKQAEKKSMQEEIQKFRKGARKDLDFLDNKNNSKKTPSKSLYKRQTKDKKYGFGGKKKRSKWNTREGVDDIGSHGKKGRKGPNKRPGKNSRQKAKNYQNSKKRG